MLNEEIILVLAFCLVCLPMLRLEFPVVLSPVQASGAGERWSVKILIPLLGLAGFASPFFLPEEYCNKLSYLIPSSDIETLAAIAVGAAAAILISSVIHRGPGVPYAVLGAVFGCQLMLNGSIDWSLAIPVVVGWLVAPLLCCGLSALLTRLFLAYSSKAGRHLAISDQRLLVGCVFGSIFLIAAFAWNAGQLITLFPLEMLGESPVPAAVAVGIVLLLYAFSAKNIRTNLGIIADKDLDMGSGHVLAVIWSVTITFALFSIPQIRFVGLVPTPLSACSLLLAALVGCSLARKQSTLSSEDILKNTAAIAVAPVLGILITYCISLILGVGKAGSSLLPVIILVSIAAIVAGMYFYIKAGRREARRQQILRSREEQIYSTQKSLSALEVRVETNEKDLLNKLEIKRKELVDFAVGVSDQKAFMETVYSRLAQARALPDGAEKDAALEDILRDLRDRMYFTHEMNDFYARTEVLHKDFNMHLKEAYPNLTEGERKLANLLRQGFSTKYIASLMNITPKSVEISRYRLRNKLGLSRSDNLVQFIKSI